MGLISKIRKIKAHLKDNRGQSTIEYILILFIVVMIAMKFKTIIVSQVVSLAEKIPDKIQTIEQDN